MTLPDEVVKEIDALQAPMDKLRATRSDIERIALLTRRLTIEECAKICEKPRIMGRRSRDD